MSEPRIDRPSLADAFKGSGSGRAASLGGLLPKTSRPADAHRPVDEPRPSETAAPPKAMAKPAAERSATPRRASAQHEGVHNVAVYLEPDILALVRAAKSKQSGCGHREVDGPCQREDEEGDSSSWPGEDGRSRISSAR